ncbi:MAG: hypothetical protein ABDK87_08510 [Atribacterota bacterium]
MMFFLLGMAFSACSGEAVPFSLTVPSEKEVLFDFPKLSPAFLS